jgi:hypothetical protein
MQRKQITKASEAPSSLQREAKAAFVLASGDVSHCFTQLFIDDGGYAPAHFDAHAWRTLFALQTDGFSNGKGEKAMFDINVRFTCVDVTIMIGAKRFVVQTNGMPHSAFRTCLLDALEAYHDAIIA